MDKVFGLPAHPLFVHVPVVLLPLSFVGLLICVIKPDWRRHLLIPTAVIALVGAFGAILASQSGEWLKEYVRETGTVEDHAQLGELARNLAILFAGGVTAVAFRWLAIERGWLEDNALGRLLRKTWVGALAAWGSVLIGIGMTYAVVQAGHTGAKAAWQGKATVKLNDSSEHDGEN